MVQIWAKAKSTCGYPPNHWIPQTKTVKMACDCRYIIVPLIPTTNWEIKSFISTIIAYENNPQNSHCFLWITPHPFQIPTPRVSTSEYPAKVFPTVRSKKPGSVCFIFCLHSFGTGTKMGKPFQVTGFRWCIEPCVPIIKVHFLVDALDTVDDFRNSIHHLKE